METFEKNLLVRRRIEDVVAREKDRVQQKKKPWPIYESSLDEYVDSFSQVLSFLELKKFLNNLAQIRGSSLKALDIAGQGHALLELANSGVGAVTAITLHDFRSLTEKTRDNLAGLQFIVGDVSRGTTWLPLRDQQFDLIMCRPMGAVGALKDSVLSLAVFNRMYSKLRPGGMLLTQVSEIFIETFGTAWISQVSTTPGLTVQKHEASILSFLEVYSLTRLLLAYLSICRLRYKQSYIESKLCRKLSLQLASTN